MKNTENALGQIQSQIMWNRLISVVEEQAQTLLRTAFSTTVREAGDLSAGVFDTKGQMISIRKLLIENRIDLLICLGGSFSEDK